MTWKKIHQLIDWCVIMIFLFFIVTTMLTPSLWEKFTYIAPPFIFLALCVLFLNHISIKSCFQKKEAEFFLMCAGIFLSGINIILIKSNIGAFFTIADFILILYLADKVHFNKIQLGAIGLTSFAVLYYWLFINKEVYGNIVSNPNGASLIIFTNFCVFICCLVYFLHAYKIPGWVFPVAALLILYIVTKRILSLHCRGVLLAIAAWAGTYYVLPKKKYTIPFVIGASLLMPVVYVLLWKSGAVDGILVFGKKIASGRDTIWYNFFNVFIQHPITGIGSNFDVMLPDLYLKEVHHALLDLLFVHGTPVFLIVLYLMYKRIAQVFASSSVPLKAICIASIYGLLTSGSFENHYIVSPYNVLLLTIFIISYAAPAEMPLKEE